MNKKVILLHVKRDLNEIRILIFKDDRKNTNIKTENLNLFIRFLPKLLENNSLSDHLSFNHKYNSRLSTIFISTYMIG